MTMAQAQLFSQLQKKVIWLYDETEGKRAV
jgi:hypothetical protein